jgi:hypothetical protein
MAQAQEQGTSVSLRRSQRELCPTEDSLQYRAEQAKKSEQIFTKTYNCFKSHLVSIRDNLKSDCTEELFELLEKLEKGHELVVNAYDDLRLHQPIIENFASYKRRADSATACNSDMVSHLNHSISEVGVKEFVLDLELDQLRPLKKPYAASVYSEISCSTHLSGDNDASVSDTEVSLASHKPVNLQQTSSQPVLHEPVLLASSLNPSAPAFAMHHHTPVVNPVVNSSASELNLAVALANAVDRNRLPIPTPKVYTGNPMDFVAFKKSFKTLIENKGISAEEKIYYLMQYVTGDAREAISGCLYGSEEADYQHAWETLENTVWSPFQDTRSLQR